MSEFLNDTAVLMSYLIWTLYNGSTSATISLTGVSDGNAIPITSTDRGNGHKGLDITLYG